MMDFIEWNPQKYNPMNDKWSRCAAGRLLMFVGGIVVSAAITQHLAEKAAEAKYDEQLAEMKEYYSEVPPVNNVSSIKVEVEVPEDLVENFQTVVNHVNHYNKLTDPVLHDKLDEYGAKHVDLNRTQVEVGRKRGRHDKIYIITPDEFEEDFENQEKVAALFYEGDMVFVDPFDDVIDNYSKVVGDAFLTQFEIVNGEEMVHVRNTVEQKDYQIELVKGRYNEIVLGMIEVPEPRQPRSLRNDE